VLYSVFNRGKKPKAPEAPKELSDEAS
jgi:hypothetical protein